MNEKIAEMRNRAWALLQVNPISRPAWTRSQWEEVIVLVIRFHDRLRQITSACKYWQKEQADGQDLQEAETLTHLLHGRDQTNIEFLLGRLFSQIISDKYIASLSK